ncbi:MAG: glycosyltransferase [Porticoccaceae bacterium]|nr:glycosyltransferase [Porticoccaceae bacterium]
MSKPINTAMPSSSNSSDKSDAEFPLITVVMPCFNAEVYLEEAVECVFEQSYPRVELIVVDDGSGDSSYALLQQLAKKHPRLKVLQQENAGPYPARNLALAQAQGELIAFLDADDYWAPDCLSKLFQALLEGDADLSYSGWQNIVEGGEDGPPYIPPAYEDGDIFAAFLKSCPWPIHAALTKRSLIEQAEGFSTRCFSSMDYDFWLRLSAISQKIARVPEVLAFYRWHNEGQISSIKWRQVIDALQVKTDFIAAQSRLLGHLSPVQLRDVTAGFITRQAYDAFWQRDLVSAQYLFRALLRNGYWKKADLKYILPSLLPPPLFRGLVRLTGS